MASIPYRPDGVDDFLDVAPKTERDLYYWCSHFRVSEGLLRETIASVGTKVADIERFLRYSDG